MSKIQDALAKLQDTSGRRMVATGSVKSRTDSTIVAKVTASDADERGNSRVVCVDQTALRDAGLIAPEYHQELLTNQYRDIKRPLIAHAFGRRATQVEDGKIIAVCSAISGEGKTFTSINLALSMAQERDHSVILIDGDFAKPTISKMFGLDAELGLLDAIENPEIDIWSLVLKTDVEGLLVFPSGRPRTSATELLNSAAMEHAVAKIGAMANDQLVIFDSAPLLQTSESKAVASLAGQVVLVVRAESTPRAAVAAALSALDDQKAVNLILNNVRPGVERFGEYYGYGATAGDSKPVAPSKSDIFA